MSALDWIARPGRALTGQLRVPGDKSISHRALMLGAVADGQTRIRGFLEGEDTLATARIFGQLGVRIEIAANGDREISGVGLHGLRQSTAPLDCGNAGTGMRLLAGLLAGQAFDCVLVGDASLSARPMGRVIQPLASMGANIESPDGRPPLRIHASKSLQAIDFTSTIASAQLKSAILLAGLYATGTTIVREPQPTRDYTERMLAAFGAAIEYQPGFAAITAGSPLIGRDIYVPADMSSAAFFLVAASLVPGSNLVLKAVGMNPRRTGLVQALRLMGADITEESRTEQGGEPVADLRVCSARLRGIDLPPALVPDMIDEVPVFMVAAAYADGPSRIRGAAELRVKESDRLAAMSAALAAMGAGVVELADGADLAGGGGLHGGRVDSRGDPHTAMSAVVAAQCLSGEVEIADCANVATSFPGFLADAAGIGMAVGPARVGPARIGQ
ncbi:3-phosphoshikimate 1-carboxyvinyltransferase [soil metagenome]